MSPGEVSQAVLDRALAERREALERAEAAERALAAADRWIAAQVHPTDHACDECIPGGPIVIQGFRCQFHESRARLASVKGKR